MPKSDLVLLREMLDLINETNGFTSGYSLLTFLEDQKTIKAIALNIQFLGETANQLSTTFTDSYQQIPWRKIVGLRHKIVHHYMSIDPEIIWDITHKDLPLLQNQLTSILSNLETQEAKSPNQ
jgi:uncharacterized protein with HEPN domain